MAARAAAGKAGTLDELQALLAGFDGCGLKATAKNLCFYRGAAAGAADADRRGARDATRTWQGKPFVGTRRPAARQDAGRHRPHRGGRAHHQHRLLAPAGKPHAHTRRRRRSAARSWSGRWSWWRRTSCCCWAAPRPRTCSASPTASCACAASGATMTIGSAHRARHRHAAPRLPVAHAGRQAPRLARPAGGEGRTFGLDRALGSMSQPPAAAPIPSRMMRLGLAAFWWTAAKVRRFFDFYGGPAAEFDSAFEVNSVKRLAA